MKSGSDIPDENAVAKEIEKMLVEAWGKFCDYYDTKAPRYRDSWRPKLKEKQAKNSHWICWNEYDLMFHVGRFFYDILKGKKESLFSNIEMHFEKIINYTNFKDYEFKDQLENLKKELKKKKGQHGPKVDMIVAYEDKSSPFLLCAEAKHFHGPPNYHDNKTPVQKIDADIAKLEAIRKLGIAKEVVFILFDDYYHYQENKETANKIQKELDRIEKEDGIKVLRHTSKAKLPGT